MSQTEEDLYKCTYPHVMPWSRKIRVLQEGQYLQKEEKLYRVKQVIYSPLANYPRIICEEIAETT